MVVQTLKAMKKPQPLKSVNGSGRITLSFPSAFMPR